MENECGLSYPDLLLYPPTPSYPSGILTRTTKPNPLSVCLSLSLHLSVHLVHLTICLILCQLVNRRICEICLIFVIFMSCCLRHCVSLIPRLRLSVTLKSLSVCLFLLLSASACCRLSAYLFVSSTNALQNIAPAKIQANPNHNEIKPRHGMAHMAQLKLC